jgi:hypothetical protein
MRLASFCLIALCAAAVAGGCTTTTDDGAAGSGGQAAPYTPEGNKKPISEGEACKMLSDAIEDAAGEVGKTEPCTVPVPQCPDYIRGSVPGKEACLQYDEGTILGCVEFYHSFTKCEEFKTRPCIIAYFKGSAPLGCPDAGTPDAGEDAPTEASNQDVQTQDVVSETADDVVTDDVVTDDVVTDDVVTDDVVTDDVVTDDVSQDVGQE